MENGALCNQRWGGDAALMNEEKGGAGEPRALWAEVSWSFPNANRPRASPTSRAWRTTFHYFLHLFTVDWWITLEFHHDELSRHAVFTRIPLLLFLIAPLTPVFISPRLLDLAV